MRTWSLRIDPLTGEEYCEVYLRGAQLLNDVLLNKGSSFTEEERNALGLQGLLKPAVSTLPMQVERTLENYAKKHTDLERYLQLSALLDRNETLFYRVLCDHLEEMLPVVYTPTVGEACLTMSHITRRYRGVTLTEQNIGQINQIFASLGRPETSLIVVTDGERILGLGDLGSDGMGIPVGKINLYVAAAGIHPACCLPVCLDVGTSCERLLDDPLYMGVRHPRLTGQAYDDFVERFVLGVQRSFPNALVQWEDFAKHTAFPLLERYRERVLSFDDDIQGTGATALAALLTARRIKGRALKDERFVIVGMGQAGVGVAQNIATVLREEGCSAEEVRARIFAIDLPGLLLEDTPGLEAPQLPYAQRRGVVGTWKLQAPGRIGLLDVVRNGGATVLIGVTAQSGLFGPEVLAALARNAERPVVMALSNPTSKSECTPLEVVRATDGKGLVATGSPFPRVEWAGRVFHASQCNNLYVFPGMGLGALVAKTPRITDGMFLAASKELARLVTAEQEASGLLLPEMQRIREVSAHVAWAVARQARDEGLGRRLGDDELMALVRRAQWDPHYYPYRSGRWTGEPTVTPAFLL
ncbi:MAG: NAD-dependent malic enzyme [Deltaproteobacteria bacterium]|nr:NAD-dependent malic enzyme [Deltaproteobacteria bacterium]